MASPTTSHTLGVTSQGFGQRFTSSSTLGRQHPLQESEDLLSCIRLLDVANFPLLATPLPRSQDLPEGYFASPSSPDDQVISVSHGWRNQAHPDPKGQKTELLGLLLSKCRAERGSSRGESSQSQDPSVFLFLDFIGIPQRPFQPEQPQRTLEEVETFKRALGCMHEMFFYSDRIIHLPWEETDVPGEGVEETIPSEALQGASFSALGKSVHVALHESWRSSQSGAGSQVAPVHMFDQVLSVDGQTITSTSQLESILAGNKAETARVRHYPFGNYSTIPADDRGWVFLERFITMVKCAMMDESTAERVVVTPSRAIFQQIMHGASVLRRASVQEARHETQGELKRVLESFIQDLASKQFSGASTDKCEMSDGAVMADDREVVCRIMRQFVEHLAVHWEAEARRQRSLAARLTAIATVAEIYLVEWDSFSEDYSAKLAVSSTANPWPVMLLLVVPLAPVLTALLWKYPDPDHRGWTGQAGFWGVGLLLTHFIPHMMFPVFLAKTTQLVSSRRVLLSFVAWAATLALLNTLLGMGISSTWEIFPVPAAQFIGVIAVHCFFPVLWWCVPKEQRASGGFRKRLFSSMHAMVVIATLYGLVVPLLNAVFPLASAAWQPLLASSYLAVKLAFELFALRLSKVLGADAMPYFVFLAAFAYHVNLCVAFSKFSSWLLAAEQICFNVLENCYHLYSLFRLDHSAKDGPRRGQYIVASLVMREFVEVVAPASFLLIYQLVRAYRPRNNALICDRAEQDVQQTVYFLLTDVVVGLLGSFVTYLLLLRWKYRPLLLLRGLIARGLFCFLLIAAVCLIHFCTMLHSHWGMDFSFKFLWLTEPKAVWVCGLTWRVPSEVI